MKPPIPKPTEGELEILRVLWRQGPSTVRSINEQLSRERTVGYTTTLKIMQIMFEKGLLAREAEGKTHVYSAQVSEGDTQQQLVDRLMHTAFGGSASRLAIQALGSGKSSPEELEEIRRLLDELSANASTE